MTKEHKHAAVLRAIADGKQIQVHGTEHWMGWKNVAPYEVLRYLGCYAEVLFRIKPETITINGVECPAPSKADSDGAALLISGGGKSGRFYFPTVDDAAQVFDALLKPFGEAV